LKRARFYLFLLCLLAVITYLDRVCISVAGPRMQDALHISPEQWGWVGTVFLLGYALFEVPSGHLGDRLGARRILTRIVLWWSVFTAATGAVSGLPMLLGARFLFGAGEAGSFPNASVAISNWFAPATRGRAFGIFTMCSQLGGALSPLLVIPIQQAFGWRASFFVFGSLGVVWCGVWYWQFRDYPAGPPRGTAVRERTAWAPLLRDRNLRAIMGLTFGYVYTMSFYQTWFHTYLVRGRGFSEDALALSSLPYVLGAVAEANRLGALTIGISCTPDSELSRAVKIAIAPLPGPEVVAGSTRLKAGTATKLVLNMLTTGAFIRMGYVWRNLMVNVQPKNTKLLDRATRIIGSATGASYEEAGRMLAAASNNVRAAIAAWEREEKS